MEDQMQLNGFDCGGGDDFHSFHNFMIVLMFLESFVCEATQLWLVLSDTPN